MKYQVGFPAPTDPTTAKVKCVVTVNGAELSNAMYDPAGPGPVVPVDPGAKWSVSLSDVNADGLESAVTVTEFVAEAPPAAPGQATATLVADPPAVAAAPAAPVADPVPQAPAGTPETDASAPVPTTPAPAADPAAAPAPAATPAA